MLLLDEPFDALDALTRSRLQDELLHIWERERITTILVTHDVAEAIYLGERIVTMAPRPGGIRRIVDVALPRPRERADPGFARLRDEILAGLSDATTPSRGDSWPGPPPDLPGQWRMAW